GTVSVSKAQVTRDSRADEDVQDVPSVRYNGPACSCPFRPMPIHRLLGVVLNKGVCLKPVAIHYHADHGIVSHWPAVPFKAHPGGLHRAGCEDIVIPTPASL